MYYMITVTCLFIIQNRKEISRKRKRKIKSRKIEKKVRIKYKGSSIL